MVSATILESVSFQRPLRSVTTSVSTRVTLVSLAQPPSSTVPANTATAVLRPRIGSTPRTCIAASLGHGTCASRRSQSLFGASPFAFFRFEPIEQPLGVLSHEIPDLTVQFFGLQHLFLHVLKRQLGEDVIGSRLVVLVSIHWPDSAERDGGEGLNGSLHVLLFSVSGKITGCRGGGIIPHQICRIGFEVLGQLSTRSVLSGVPGQRLIFHPDHGPDPIERLILFAVQHAGPFLHPGRRSPAGGQTH